MIYAHVVTHDPNARRRNNRSHRRSSRNSSSTSPPPPPPPPLAAVRRLAACPRISKSRRHLAAPAHVPFPPVARSPLPRTANGARLEPILPPSKPRPVPALERLSQIPRPDQTYRLTKGPPRLSRAAGEGRAGEGRAERIGPIFRPISRRPLPPRVPGVAAAVRQDGRVVHKGPTCQPINRPVQRPGHLAEAQDEEVVRERICRLTNPPRGGALPLKAVGDRVPRLGLALARRTRELVVPAPISRHPLSRGRREDRPTPRPVPEGVGRGRRPYPTRMVLRRDLARFPAATVGMRVLGLRAAEATVA